MKSLLIKLTTFAFILISPLLSSVEKEVEAKDFQGKAIYISKSKMDLGTWGARLTELQKKQIAARMKNRLEKKYVLTFNKQESFFKEEEKLDAISGATDSWGKNFTAGDQYKNVKDVALVQSQEFYGKPFLVKDKLQKIDWKLGSETRQIGNYICYKATALIPSKELTWYEFSWSKIRAEEKAKEEGKEQEVAMSAVEAWYSPQIPVSHGPLEYWGLPGLILEVSTGNTTLLCTEIAISTNEKVEIKAPKKGDVVTKEKYQTIVFNKMKEFRDSRMGRRRSR